MKFKTTLTVLAAACALALGAQAHAFNGLDSLARTLDEVADMDRVADEAGRAFRGGAADYRPSRHDRDYGRHVRYDDDDDDDDRRNRRWDRDDDDDDDDRRSRRWSRDDDDDDDDDRRGRRWSRDDDDDDDDDD